MPQRMGAIPHRDGGFTPLAFPVPPVARSAAFSDARLAGVAAESAGAPGNPGSTEACARMMPESSSGFPKSGNRIPSPRGRISGELSTVMSSSCCDSAAIAGRESSNAPPASRQIRDEADTGRQVPRTPVHRQVPCRQASRFDEICGMPYEFKELGAGHRAKCTTRPARRHQLRSIWPMRRAWDSAWCRSRRAPACAIRR